MKSWPRVGRHIRGNCRTVNSFTLNIHADGRVGLEQLNPDTDVVRNDDDHEYDNADAQPSVQHLILGKVHLDVHDPSCKRGDCHKGTGNKGDQRIDLFLPDP